MRLTQIIKRCCIFDQRGDGEDAELFRGERIVWCGAVDEIAVSRTGEVDDIVCAVVRRGFALGCVNITCPV